MKRYWWLLRPFVLSFFFITPFHPSLALAQETLPTLIKKVSPSTVVIVTYNKEGKTLGEGSGFFISKGGDIITNRHVIEGAVRADVKAAGRSYPILRIVAKD